MTRLSRAFHQMVSCSNDCSRLLGSMSSSGPSLMKISSFRG
jgi:hypothetical protein